MPYDTLLNFYNNKYTSDKQTKVAAPICVAGYPKDRFEAAVYWGKGSGRAMEIAGGSGNVAFTLKDQYDEYIITELSGKRIESLKAIFQNDPKVKIINNDIEEKNLNFPNGYFDTIIMIAVIEHLIDPISVCRYCWSLLKPGGRLIINTPNIAKWTRRLKLLFGIFPSTASRGEGLITYDNNKTALYDEGHLHYFTFRSLKKILIERTSFASVKYYGYGRGPLSRFVPKLFSDCLVVATKGD